MTTFMPTHGSIHSQLDQLLPVYDFHERHHRLVLGPRDRVSDAMNSVTLREMPLVRLLLALRSLPVFPSGKHGLPRKMDEPLLGQMIARGFTLLAEDPGVEIVIGTIAQMWKRGGEAATIRDREDFLAFDRPGFVKVAMNFLLVEQQDGTRIETETRVLATDPESRKGFSRYWRVIRLGSAAIRRIWLRAIARRAETGSPPGPVAGE